MDRSRAARIGGGFLALMLGASAPLTAQSVSIRSDSVVGRVTGVVTDSLRRPIADAVVYLSGVRREVRTRSDGSYVLNIPARGRYTLGARKLGFLRASEEVKLDSGVTRVDFELTRLPDFLPSVITTAARGGLSGVVLEKNGTPVPNAVVTPLGAGVGGTRTNGDGEFFLAVNGGNYLVRFDKPGLRTHLISVTVPKEQGKRMTATMDVQLNKPNPIEGVRLFDLRQRLIRANPVWQRLVTREDLERFGHENAFQVARRFTASPLTNDECATLDGGTAQVPLWAIDVDEIEFMETTASPPPRIPPFPPVCRHVVWLRR